MAFQRPADASSTADTEDLKSSGGNARVGSDPTAANHSSRPAVGVQKSNARGVSQRCTR
jgi:hypothetical protein